jgi:protein-L-isoaspartate(D-aspartate) O-methyltransferase
MAHRVRRGPVVPAPAAGYNATCRVPDGSKMSKFAMARSHMIESQLRTSRVTDERVLAAFWSIRRELFVPDPLRAVAYIDDDLPLGAGRYLMEPMVAARLIQAATVARSDTVLVVGAGTGYESAVLSVLARKVVALEGDADLARRARAALVDHAIASVESVEGPLRRGHRPRAPYDAILFGGAVAAVPQEIVDQLADGGRLLAVERSGGGIGHAVLIKQTGGTLARRVIFDAATPLLPSFEPSATFVF